MLARTRMIFAFLGFSTLLSLAACDDEEGEATDETGDESDGGW
jgi:hypothetical protein